MSRATGLWVAMKIVADVADGTGTMELDRDAFHPIPPPCRRQALRPAPDGRLLTPHTIELEQEIIEVRYELARRYAPTTASTDSPSIRRTRGSGSSPPVITYREVLRSVRPLGLDDEASIAAAASGC